MGGSSSLEAAGEQDSVFRLELPLAP